jgi:hypothetical protein
VERYASGKKLGKWCAFDPPPDQALVDTRSCSPCRSLHVGLHDSVKGVWRAILGTFHSCRLKFALSLSTSTHHLTYNNNNNTLSLAQPAFTATYARREPLSRCRAPTALARQQFGARLRSQLTTDYEYTTAISEANSTIPRISLPLAYRQARLASHIHFSPIKVCFTLCRRHLHLSTGLTAMKLLGRTTTIWRTI